MGKSKTAEKPPAAVNGDGEHEDGRLFEPPPQEITEWEFAVRGDSRLEGGADVERGHHVKVQISGRVVEERFTLKRRSKKDGGGEYLVRTIVVGCEEGFIE